MTDTPVSSYDVAIVGGGPAGLAAAIAIAETGARTALVARRAPYGDNRTTALLGGSVDFLNGLGVWQRCAGKAAAAGRPYPAVMLSPSKVTTLAG